MGAALGTPAVAPAVDVTAPVAETTAPAEIAVDSAAPISPLPGAPAVTGGAPGSLLPRLLANLPLAPEGATLNDLRFDPGANRLYIADTDEQVHVVDATTYTVLTTLPGLGSNLELDTRNGRLYVYRAYVREGEEPAIHVIDTATLAEVGVLRGGAIAIDAERNRLFVGAPFTYSSPADAPGVQVIDGATLQVLGEIDQPGAPLYNPARNEVLIVAYTVYTADPETLQVTGDLFPELTDLNQIGFLWCNGCRWAERAWVLPETGMIAVDIRAHCTGKGCGVEDAPRWLDAGHARPNRPGHRARSANKLWRRVQRRRRRGRPYLPQPFLQPLPHLLEPARQRRRRCAGHAARWAEHRLRQRPHRPRLSPGWDCTRPGDADTGRALAGGVCDGLRRRPGTPLRPARGQSLHHRRSGWGAARTGNAAH
jgi:hypothetical protein